MSSKGSYYVPKPSHWPIVGSIGLFFMLIGMATWLHGDAYGPYLCIFGTLIFVYMLFGWFKTVINENRAGLLNDPQVERSFRISVIWFIFTELCFFAALFGALFYARVISVPSMGPNGDFMTHILLYPHFSGTWPVFHAPNPALFKGPESVTSPWGIPIINTFVMLLSSATITVAMWALVKQKRGLMKLFQFITILLGITFLCLQAQEYWVSYTLQGLQLSSGIYGATFYMITGFDALHVAVGVIMLAVILFRMFKGDFTKNDHFAFAAVSWYWHFVDLVWLLIFTFVYWV